MLNSVYKAVSPHLRDRVFIRKLYRAIADPRAGVNKPANYIKMTTDKEVQSFLQLTKTNPIRILGIFHCYPLDINILLLLEAEPCFKSDKFALEEKYNDTAEDFDVLQQDFPGVARWLYPTTDYNFEHCEASIRKRIKKQEDLLPDMKSKY